MHKKIVIPDRAVREVIRNPVGVKTFWIPASRRNDVIAGTSGTRSQQYNAKAYIYAFMRNVDWKAVETRYEDASKVEPPRPLVQQEFGDLPGVAVEEVKAMMDSGQAVQIIDARPRHSVSKQPDIMDGAQWRDPDRVQEWAGELSKSDPVVVFCVYGFHVGCKTAIALRDAGFDAKYMQGGHSAWKAISGSMKTYSPSA